MITPPSDRQKIIEPLVAMANRLRHHSVVATSAAGSGHPTSCLSCADLIAALFFHIMEFDVERPDNRFNDRFILSKGHAAPILWAAWAEAGGIDVDRLTTLRRVDSDLEGHPTPRNPYVDAATGSLGQGLSVGNGMALASRIDDVHNRIFVLLGDGETAEGAVWEAAAQASYHKLGNLTALLDVNRLGQSEATMYQHDTSVYQRRFEACGWNTILIDGHDMNQILDALDQATASSETPTVIIARTLKGKGVSFLEDQDGKHGKAVPDDQLDQALEEIGENPAYERARPMKKPEQYRPIPRPAAEWSGSLPAPEYQPDDKVATRQAYGYALEKLGHALDAVVGLDGDVKNSTYSQVFAKTYPERFIECFIAEQNMIGVALGLAAMGKLPYVSSFACFLTRAYDQVRMAGLSQVPIRLCGSHSGVSIGEDGPSQMGLEDLAFMRTVPASAVLCPSDAVSAEGVLAASVSHPGLVYFRTARPKTPILYSADEEFLLGGSKTLRSSDHDRVTLLAAGYTVHEALKAADQLAERGINVRVIDMYSVKPLDRETLRRASRETELMVTVEDHYPAGGLGEAVAVQVAGHPCDFLALAVEGLPRSGSTDELLEQHGISASRIVQAVTTRLQ